MNYAKPILAVSIDGLPETEVQELICKIKDSEVSKQYNVFFTNGNDMLKVLNGEEVKEMSVEGVAQWIKDSH